MSTTTDPSTVGARGSWVPPLLTLLLGVAALIVASDIPAGRLDNDPGPAFLPQLAGIVLLVASAWLVWRREPHDSMPRGAGLTRVAVTALLALAYVLAIEPMGFPTATFLFLLVEMYLVGLRRLVLLVPAALLLAVGVYALFRYGLEVPLPGIQIGGRVL
ncbi:tripartite tricarboxylate transporter TctB family protein [Nocardioides sambongensis]|uniref:tripartite tricarboxylate transporter TctB family protein n=1 Tax=Nocardioides sambongensis TaxID=2589074 RepID=UPI0011273D09|nr:tripartite tricarboxylate transporter TctB family protein [Nocardioides sambongensis]